MWFRGFLAALLSFIAFQSTIADDMVQSTSRVVFFDSEPPNCRIYRSDEYLYVAQSYCSRTDWPTMRPHRYVQFISGLDPKSIRAISMLYYGSDNASFASTICSILSPNISRLQLAIQKDEPVDGLRRIESCANSLAIPVTRTILGRDSEFSSFHLKLLLVETTKNFMLMTASGNPTINSEAYHDYEIAFEGPSESTFMQWHSCVAAALAVPSQNVTRAILKSRYEGCRGLRSGEPVTPFLLPYDSEALVDTWKQNAKIADHIDVITQHANSATLRGVLLAAMKSGTQVRIIMDDDIIRAKLAKPTAPETKYFNSVVEYDRWLAPLIQAGAQVRYVTTNHHTQPRNFVHMKMVNFVKENASFSIFGGANLTWASLNSNLENVYGTGDAAIVKRFTATFERYWSTIALPFEKLPPDDRPPIPTAN